jgi:hypothetical protein
LKITEISYADYLEVPKISNFGEPCKIERHKEEDITFYTVRDDKEIVLTFIGLGAKQQDGYFPMHRIGNPSKIKGLVSQLLVRLTSTGIKIKIESDEPLTPEGERWVLNFLNHPQPALKITDQTGGYPSMSAIHAEWLRTKNDQDYNGIITIYIE